MTRHLAIAAMLLAAACNAPDYTPVRDWARTASLAADFPAAQLPPPPAVEVRDGGTAMREALAIYLAALARLADDGVLPYPENPFATLAPQAAEMGGEAPVAALGAFLRRATRQNWQAPRLREAIVLNDPAVQSLARTLVSAIGPNPGPEDRPAIAAARSQYAAIIRRIAEDHAFLAAQADDITDAAIAARIRAAQDRLERALLALPRPTLAERGSPP
jgi:hypothetical protein